jgi:hypothetical protein
MYDGVAEDEAEEVHAHAARIEEAEEAPRSDGPDVDVEEDAGSGDATFGSWVALLVWWDVGSGR